MGLLVSSYALRNVSCIERNSLGLLSIASYSYLISITQREQVAQIFGKPVFVVTGVAFTPLTSQLDATKSITEAVISQEKGESVEHDTDSSGDSDAEPVREPQTPADPIDSNPTHEDGEGRLLQSKSTSGTNIVQDVIINRVQYGKVASQWFSRKAWTQGRQNATIPSASEQLKPFTDVSLHVQQDPKGVGQRSAIEAGVLFKNPSQEAAVALIPKILNSTRLILTSKSFFFSYDIDITHRMGTRTFEQLNYHTTARTLPDPRYFWNKNLASEFTASPKDSFLLPIMQGFVGQRSFVVEREDKDTRAVEFLESADTTKPESRETATTSRDNYSQTFILTLISRRSTKRSGLRYLRRGIDDQGDCANAVETEQILCSPSWDTIKIRSFSQYRGSIPLYFSQTPYAFKPVPILHQSSNKNQVAMRKHFEALEKDYGNVQAALLVDKHGPEFGIGEAYVEAVKELNGALKPPVDIHWFDFHAECRGMKFENVDRLVKVLRDKIDSFGETVVEEGAARQTQKGIIRTNCMDCLDRTNVSQSAIGQYVLQKDLESEGYHIDLLHDEATQWFNSLWADNGDAVSRQYAGTAALKGDFTRTRKRNYRGALNDLGLTLNRYYNNMVNDFFSQAVIDLLVGNVTSKVFEDFESDMMSADPGISLSGVRHAAIETCTKIVVQDDEDLIHGYTLMSPAQPNTLRTLPFEEVVVLLTDANLYCCKFDWNSTQKISSFEKIDLRSITKLQYGTYITSTLSERQMVEALNVGLVIQYNPDKNSVMRVNTRSLQNVVSNEQVPHGVDGGTGLMSWVISRTSDNNSRTMALKVIPAETGLPNPKDTPLAIAERICDDIRRAVTGSTLHGEQMGEELVAKGDIISLAEAKKRTGYLEQLGHSIKKLVWT